MASYALYTVESQQIIDCPLFHSFWDEGQEVKGEPSTVSSSEKKENKDEEPRVAIESTSFESNPTVVNHEYSKRFFADFCREFVTLFYQDVAIFCYEYVCMQITAHAPVFFGSLSRL